MLRPWAALLALVAAVPLAAAFAVSPAKAATPSVLACAGSGAKRLALTSAARRHRVAGDNRWPDARFALRRGTTARSFTGTTVPARRGTGSFTTAIRPRAVRGTVPLRPAARRTPACLEATDPVAITLDGVLVLPALSARRSGDTRGGSEVDRCGGSVDATGLYAIRRAPACLPRATADGHGGLVGWARDGAPLFGPTDRGGRRLRSRDLDACHGHTHTVRIDGRAVRRYHHHVTGDFPYTVGCFRATPAAWVVGSAAAPAPAPALTPAPAPAASPGAAPAIPSTPAEEPQGLAVTADPGLRPAFDRAITDYVTRCADGPVTLAVRAPDGTTVAVDGADAAGGSFTRTVALRDSQAFAFSVTADGTTTTHHVRCLPADFPATTVERSGEPGVDFIVAAPSLTTALTPADDSYVAVFDDRGTPVWWAASDVSRLDAKLLPNGNLAWIATETGGYGIDPDAAYEERRLDGALLGTVKSVAGPTDHHDLQRLPNGNSLVLTYVPRAGVDLSPWGLPANARVLDAHVEEITPGGSVAWSWSSEDHIATAESGRWLNPVFAAGPTADGTPAYDIVHANGIEPDGDGILLSARHLDAIYRIDRATGDVDWKLGGTTTPQSLTVVGDDRGADLLSGQHDVRRLPDGTVTVYDNATQTDAAPRAVRFAIDPVARTATRVDELTDPAITGSRCCGSARRLADGGWLAAWGGNATIAEYAPNGTRRLAITFDGLFSYRADPVVGGLTAAELRAGMDAQHPR